MKELEINIIIDDLDICYDLLCKYKKECSDNFFVYKIRFVKRKTDIQIYSTINKESEKYNCANHEKIICLNNNKDILESDINQIIGDIIRNSKMKSDKGII